MRSMIRRITCVLGALAVLGASVAAEASAEPVSIPTEDAVAGQQLSWQDCGDGVRCADLEVPLDWSKPWDQRTTTVGLGMLPAHDQRKKLGTLVANFGGPGPAIPSLRNPKALAELRNWYDIVAFDPRGFGDSEGVLCPTAGPTDLAMNDPTRAGYEQHIANNHKFAERCAATMGDLAGKINAWQVTHDVEAIRVALGEGKLNYFGNSYGAVYGQVYADLFGHNVHRMFLDSAVDHTDPNQYSWIAGQAAAVERNLHEFADWCAETVDCALHGRDVLAVWDRVLAAATREPIPAPGAGPDAAATSGSIIFTAVGSTGRDQNWPQLADALAAADRGDGTLFVRQELPPEPREMAMLRIGACGDFAYEDGYDELERIAHKLRERVAPRMGWSRIWTHAHMCGGLPNTGAFAPEPIRAEGMPPALVTNGSRDMATPEAGARRVATQLGAHYLPTVGFHALYLGGNDCVREHAHRYLTTGQLPKHGTSCPAG